MNSLFAAASADYAGKRKAVVKLQRDSSETNTDTATSVQWEKIVFPVREPILYESKEGKPHARALFT